MVDGCANLDPPAQPFLGVLDEKKHTNKQAHSQDEHHYVTSPDLRTAHAQYARVAHVICRFRPILHQSLGASVLLIWLFRVTGRYSPYCNRKR